VRKADILILGTPLWLGEESSLCRVVIERLYAHSAETNADGQYVFYGKTGGCIVTGNEDGIKHAAMTIHFAMQHIGYTIPPQADCGWIGEAGPGPSYGDDGAGLDNDFTRRNTTFMSWNLLHMARLLKDAGGIPAYGNVPAAWKAGNSFGHPDQ
jgi:multimeric flavodoxin WrbA